MSPHQYINLNVNDLKVYLGILNHYVLIIFWYLFVIPLGCLILAHVCCFCRFISIKFGKRIAPDVRKGVVITGATSGFGLAVSKHLYKLGFTVFACYYNDQEPGFRELLELSETRNNNSKNEGEVRVDLRPYLFLIKMDVTSLDSIEDSRREIVNLLDKYNLKIHCLLNNAGLSAVNPFYIESIEVTKRIIHTNLLGTLMVTRKFIYRLIKDKGRVVNVSSGLYNLPREGIAAYGCSKAAISYYSQCLSKDLEPYGIPCIFIAPGYFPYTSNIIYTIVQSFERSVANLAPEERELYADAIERSRSTIEDTLKMKLVISKDDPQKVKSIYNIPLPESKDGKYELAKIGAKKRILRAFMHCLDGGGNRDTLEKTGSIRAFEEAVCLKAPPMSLFAGDNLYSYVFGPLLDYIPINFTHSLISDLHNEAVKSY